MKRIYPLDTIKRTIRIIGSEKDFPAKDYGKKRGWDYDIVFCLCGNLLYLQKSYCKICKGTTASTPECKCKKPYGGFRPQPLRERK